MSLRTFLTQVLQLLKGERREQPAAAAAPRPAARPIRFTRLEDRRVFNASFVLNAAGLTVDNFTAPGALQVSEGPGDLQFQLGSGMGEWIGNTAPGISILNNGTLLSVQESLLQGPGQSGNLSIFAESPQGDVDVFVNDAISLSTGSTAAQLSIHSDGNVLLTHATRGPNPILDAPDHQIRVTAAGRIDIGGIVHGKSVELDAGGDILVAGRVDSRSWIQVKSLAEILDGQIEQLSFRGDLLDITAAKGIGNADTLETDVRSLTAINTSEGTIDITETGTPGNLTIGRIENIGRSVRLQVDGGSLIDGNDLAGIQTNIQARDLFLQIGQDIGSSGPNPFPLFRNHIDVLLSGNLTATAPGFAAFSGRIDGQLAVQAHDLTLASLNDVDFTRAAQSSLQGLALIADLDGNGSGTVLIGDQLSLPESLLIQGADVQASDGTIDLSAGRILFVSGQSEDVHLNLLPGQTGQPGQFDGRVTGNLEITADSAVALVDLDGNGQALQSTVPGGSLKLTAAGDVLVQGKVSAAGSISLSAGGSMRVFGVIDPDTVTLTAADDLVISGAVSAATSLQVVAGTDGTGSLLTTSTAFVEAGVPGIPGVMLLRSGDREGNTELNGTVRARGAITVTAAGGSINGSTELSAPQLSLRSLAGIGNPAPLRIRAATIDADSVTNGIFLKNTLAATYTSLSSGSGSIIVESEPSADFVSAFAGTGSLRFSTVDGDLKVQQAITEVGNIVLLSGGQGLVLVGNAIAGGQIRIQSGTAVAELDDDPDADLRGHQIAIQAVTGIGTAAGAIEVDGPDLTLAALTATGDIHLQALENVFVGQVAEFQGLRISDPGDMNPATSISLGAGGVISVVSSIENLAHGLVALTAGQDIFQEAPTRIVTGGNGLISLIAGVSQQGSLPGSIQMTEGAVISSQQGQISLRAAGDVVLAEVLSLSGDISIEAGNGGAIGSIVDNSVEETLNLATNGLLTLRASTNIGGPNSQQDLNVQVFGLQATAGSGGIYVRSADFLRIHKSGLQTLGGAGDILVTTAAGGIEVDGRIQAAGIGRIDLTAAGDLKTRFGITSEAGSIRLAARRIEAEVAGDISTGGDGSISLQALNSEILMNPGVTFNAQNGDITLQAATQVLVSDLNTAGNVSITAAQGRLIDNNDTPTTKRTNITAADVKLNADSIEQRPVDFFTGLPDALEVSISGNLSVSVQQFAALQGSIAGTDLLEAETLFLMSAGNLGFSTVNPSVTNLALLADVDGNNNGTLFFSTPVAVSGDLRISGADIDAGSPGIKLTARNVLLQSGQSESVRLTLNDPGTGLRGSLDARSGGALDITASTAVQLRDLDGSGQALASTSGTGSLKLQADGAIRVDGKIFTGSDVVLVSSADIVINDAIDPTSITITAADDITISGQLQATSLISVSAGSDGSGDLQATAEAGMRAGSSSAGTGTIRLTAGQNSGNIQLQGTVQAGSLLVIAAASGSVNGTAQLESGILDIDAGTGIGNKQPLHVLVNSLSADTQTGDIRIVSNQPAIASSLTSGAGSIDFRGFGPTEVQVASTGEGHLSIEITRGQLTAGQITAPLGSVFLHTIETGSIVVDAVAAGQSILADSADSITEADEDPEADLHSTGIALAAVHRIGSAGNPLELDGIELQLAAQSDDAAIQLAALNSISVGNVLNRSGLVIRNASGTAAPAGIRLTSAGRVLLDTDVVNHSRGDIWLQADGDLQQRSGSAVRTFDGGTIVLQAGAPFFGSQGGLGNSITQDDGTTINAHHGKISLQATGDIRIASLASVDGSMVLSAGGTLTPGAIVDNSLSENPNLTTAGTVSLSATASIGGPAPAEDINLNVTALEASSTFGSIHLRSIGSVRLHGMGLRTANAAGNIELTTDAGPIDAAAEVHAANAGNIALRAAEQLILRRSITSDSGFITLNGSRVFAEAAGDVTTGQFGSIVLNAFTEDIVLDQDASLTAGNGFISLQASRSIFLSRLTTNGNVVAVSVSGDIIDANDNSTPRTLNITANNLTLTAANIGTAVDNFFTGLPDGLEIDLTGTLTVQAQSFAALRGSINGTGSLAAETLFLMSDQNIVFSTPALPLVTNLALLAGSDGGGPGTLTLQNPVAVTGNLRISAGDIDGGTSGTRLTARNLLLESGQSEQIRIELNGPSANQPGRLDARSAADLQIIAAGDVELQDLDGSGTALASSLATGNLMLDASGRLRVSGKVLTQGNIALTSGADIVVDAPVDPDNITISAADDITINSHIAANRLVKISAGDDGTGDLLTTTASLIEAGGTAANGDMTLSAGNTSGEIRLNGTVRATDSLTVSALGGSINGSSELTARFLAMRAATGIGNTAPLRLNAGTVSAESLNGDISLTSNTAAVYSTVSTGTGSVTL
ncbi:MAG: beta strand repeat-containing protein, partial [Planctomyces sp.]